MKHLITFIFALMLGLVGVTVGYADEKAADKADGQSTSGGNMSTILIETNKGDIKVELDAAKAPKTVANILAYVNEGFYDGTIFHRVIPGFMIQGGGMTPDMREKADKRPPIENEADNGLKNDRGTLAMARTNDPHSASSQFFINVKDNDFLNFRSKTPQGWGYAVFGKVVEGMDVVDAIVGVKTGNSGFHQDVPVEPVIMTKVSVVK
ncbi:MAG: peptidyl-prolyl cis-trans isomerase [Candidatus Thiothrix singaporensis]|uniref:Peptidyl-prolyl cis-trans isomerase n=1 Tax=Candidatus Thiothrix singaporensis TaxID=2799669 RepID=A0A7L6ATS1_9GAMM|nr:MAG: peptidyl-prolyl cis-trans isomerase [Candidatus Thiothrix singaporensis]